MVTVQSACFNFVVFARTTAVALDQHCRPPGPAEMPKVPSETFNGHPQPVSAPVLKRNQASSKSHVRYTACLVVDEEYYILFPFSRRHVTSVDGENL